MKFNLVHDIQSSYRKVIKAFSYPGEIISLEAEAKKIDFKMDVHSATQIMMYMLLDTDTTFCVIGDEILNDEFAQLTYSVKSDVSQAQYLFVQQSSNNQLADIITQANEGSLINPHMSATIIVECNEINQENMYRLQGCGIKDSITIGIDINADWLTTRNLKNMEFPLGIDLFFVDKKANCVALPRTTQIVRV